MADGFRRVYAEVEVAGVDGKIGGDGEFFTGPEAEEGTVVSDTETQTGGASGGCTPADNIDKIQFT